MRIAVIGTGGVGGYFGAKMAKAGYDVSFLARSEHLKKMLADGLSIKSINGDFKVHPINASDNLEGLGKADLVILALKAWQVKDILNDLPKIMNKDTVVLPLQNGVLTADDLQEQINKKNIIGGLCRIISEIESPGVIVHHGVTPMIIMGELDNSKTERIQSIKELFDTAGIKSRAVNDIHAELWKKFIAICISGLLAVTQSTYGEVRENDETRALMIELLEEVYQVSQKAGINIGPDFLGKTISFIDSFPYNTTSSLTRDVWQGRPSEIEYQNGTVVKLGKKYNVHTPVNRFIYNCILPMEKRARSNSL